MNASKTLGGVNQKFQGVDAEELKNNKTAPLIERDTNRGDTMQY